MGGFEFFVDAETGGGVGYLAEEGGAEAGVETTQPGRLEDVDEGGDHG